MTKIDESQVKVALSSIKEARRAHPNLSRTNLSERARMPTDQRAIEEFVGPVLNRIGLDAGKFDKLRAQNQIEFRRILEKQKADAVRESSSARARTAWPMRSAAAPLDRSARWERRSCRPAQLVGGHGGGGGEVASAIENDLPVEFLQT